MFGDIESNPMGWKKMSVGDLSTEKLSYGVAASAKEYDGKIRYVRITDIDDSGRLGKDFVSPSEYSDQHILNPGEILFARSGSVEKTYQCRESDGFCIYAGYLIRFIPNKNIIDPEFAFQETKTEYYLDFVNKAKRGATQANINAKQFGSLQFIVPPMNLQREFVDFAKQVDKSKFSKRSS